MQKVKRLFEDFQPDNYQLHLSLDAERMTFNGTVTIRGKKTGRPSKRLTFHQKGLKVLSAQINRQDKKGAQTFNSTRINNQNTYDEVRLHSDSQLFPGQYTIIMEFEGRVTKPMNGIYPCFFKHAGKDKVLLATQFESHHAREAFPCIDEPEAKATFDLALTTQKGNIVLANTPARTTLDEGQQIITIFETTPKMSVYLLAFVVGDLAYKELETKNGVKVRAYTTPDNVELTKHCLSVAVKSLEFFTDYFDTPYPLPKLDMVALPDFSSGAMENWGLITYRESAMLTDLEHSGIENQQLVALVVTHEISHQWFGNLVTMKWWDDLWLNESFANLMEYRAVDELYPEWKIWEQFVSIESSGAKRRDSLLEVQSVQSELRHPDEISTLFDPYIVYAKGGTILYMLLNYIGEESFRKGLRGYFQKHKFGNTQADDLWAALAETSGMPVGDFMHSWLTRPGYPMVSVDWEPGSPTAKLTQKRFLSDPQALDKQSKPWPTPLASTLDLSNNLLDKVESSVTVVKSDKPLLLNHDGRSYFLPHYMNSKHLASIPSAIKARKVSDIDRLLLLDNYILLQRSGTASTTDLLNLLTGYLGEMDASVWGSIAGSLAEARKLTATDEPSDERLNRFISELIGNLIETLGWQDKQKDLAQTLHLRGLIFSLAASAKQKDVINQGLALFKKAAKPKDLSASTRSVVYFVASRHGSNADFKKLLKMYDNTTSADEKDEIASGLTSAKDPLRYSQLITMIRSDSVRHQDVMHWFVWLLRNRYSRQDAWNWLTENWPWIEETFSSDKSYGLFASYCGNIFSTRAEQKQFVDFFGPKESVISLKRCISLAKAEIAGRVAWREANEKPVRDWLSKHFQ